MRVRGSNDIGRAVQTDPTLGPFIRGKIRRVLNKTQAVFINGTFRLK